MTATAARRLRREADALRALRRRLTPLERQRLRELGRTLTLAVEATCRNFDRGEREADVAGHLAHRLIREGVVPVGSPRRGRRSAGAVPPAHIQGVAHPAAGDDRRHRPPPWTVRLGDADRLVRPGRSTSTAPTMRLATMVDATCIFFSRPGRGGLRGLPPGEADLREVRPSRTNGPSITRGTSSAIPPARSSSAPTARSSSSPTRRWPGARASAPRAPRTPSSSTPAATRSSPRPRIGPSSTSPSRASSSPARPCSSADRATAPPRRPADTAPVPLVPLSGRTFRRRPSNYNEVPAGCSSGERMTTRMQLSWKFGRFAGIDVFVHPTFLFLVLPRLLSGRARLGAPRPVGSSAASCSTSTGTR